MTSNNINDKLVTVDERLDEQDKHLGELDDKTLLNVPLWSKSVALLLANEWVLIAKRLNFYSNRYKRMANTSRSVYGCIARMVYN